MDVIKLYWSSLFSRHQPFAIVGGAENTLLYTTITPLEIDTYRPVIEDYIHVVTFKDPIVYSIVVSKLMKNMVACYNIRDCTSVLNKQKELFTLKLLKNGEIWPTSEPLPPALVMCEDSPDDGDDEEADADGDSDDEAETESSSDEKKLKRQYYGWNLSEHAMYQYTNLVTQFTEGFEFKEFDVLADTQDRTLVYPVTVQAYGGIKIPVRQGFNIPALIEYSTKSKSSYVFKAQVAKDHQAVRVYFEYDDALVNVKSFQPGMVWFPKS
jgi:hypothetical protein